MNKDEAIKNLYTDIITIGETAEDVEEIATYLYDLNYRKIGEEIVIVDREAWENSHKQYARLYKDLQDTKRGIREVLHELKDHFVAPSLIDELAQKHGIELRDHREQKRND